MRCGKVSQRTVKANLIVATRTNALWQRVTAFTPEGVVESQPARMRCGKAPSQKGAACWSRSQPFANALRQSLHVKPSACVSAVATRTNALWQRCLYYTLLTRICVATRTNALWQRTCRDGVYRRDSVATRANALRQRKNWKLMM